ncbi:hypothetical protein SAMN02745130_01996 [Thiothrix eikelboomii]|uniref:Uncharacterized protein n=2 Tax=Thiothrix eikelboomii TaxID=92487 RepID=A0A1T4WQA2_9GAMM|nr:hypothetical protein SAMN02745130_01996 [Thiothrix eikelboomii]
MLYLIGQILVIVLVGTFAGLGLGWWSRGLMADLRPPATKSEEETDPFGARSRLEQCHRDNAALRRDLRETADQLEQMQKATELTREGDMVGRLQAAEVRVQALLDDLQVRDDTIAVLEKELDALRARP